MAGYDQDEVLEQRLRAAARAWNDDFEPRHPVHEVMTQASLLQNQAVRQARWRMPRANRASMVAACVLALLVAGAITWYSAAQHSSSGHASASGLATCGTVPTPPSEPFELRLSAPKSGVAGTQISVRVSVTSDGATKVLNASAPASVLVVSGTSVVGAYRGAIGGTGIGIKPTAQNSVIHTVPVLLLGCPLSSVDYAHPNASRHPLPPGEYELVAVLWSDSGDYSVLVSAPTPITVLAD